MLGSSRNWQAAGKDLAARYRVLAPDLRNHGASPHSEEMTFDAMAGDVLAWMDSHALERISLMGHSMGGKVAMVLACRHPERVQRLILVDIAPKDYPWRGREREFAAMNALDLRNLRLRAHAERSFEAYVPNPEMRRFLATNLERVDGGGWKWAVNLPALAAALPVLEKNPLGPGDRYTGPTLVLSGARSSYVRPEDGPLFAAHFPDAKFAVIESAGHNPHAEAREKFVQAVFE
jgi:pimeloyl-ACP methyl ester carboxylesterase